MFHHDKDGVKDSFYLSSPPSVMNSSLSPHNDRKRVKELFMVYLSPLFSFCNKISFFLSPPSFLFRFTSSICEKKPRDTDIIQDGACQELSRPGNVPSRGAFRRVGTALAYVVEPGSRNTTCGVSPDRLPFSGQVLYVFR